MFLHIFTFDDIRKKFNSCTPAEYLFVNPIDLFIYDTQVYLFLSFLVRKDGVRGWGSVYSKSVPCSGPVSDESLHLVR